MTLWHGRFTSEPSAELWDFTESLSFDKSLALDDLNGSRAHLAGLQKAGIITATEAASLMGALVVIEGEFSSGSFVYEASDEDIHTAI